MSLNFLLPMDKVQNHCDVTFFDGKNCHGKVVASQSDLHSLSLILLTVAM
jgi:hypothetical protein